MKLRLVVVLVLLCGARSEAFADLAGRYVAEADASIALVLAERDDGVITGTVEGLARPLRLNVRRAADQLEGTIAGTEVLDLRARIDGDTITLLLNEGVDEEAHVFRREGAAVARYEPRQVTVNDQRLTDDQLTALERTYGVRIEDADYWYDGRSGAWGLKGGPTRGFIYSELDLGGRLASDASGGGTGVFVNGRELHPLDVRGLQRCVQVYPGRYWVGPDGTGGYEGGPPLFNLVALCSPPSGGGRAGGWVCDGASCGTSRTVTGPYAVTSEGDGRAGVYTDQGLILTPN